MSKAVDLVRVSGFEMIADGRIFAVQGDQAVQQFTLLGSEPVPSSTDVLESIKHRHLVSDPEIVVAGKSEEDERAFDGGVNLVLRHGNNWMQIGHRPADASNKLLVDVFPKYYTGSELCTFNMYLALKHRSSNLEERKQRMATFRIKDMGFYILNPIGIERVSKKEFPEFKA